MDPSRLSPAALVGEVVLKPETTAFLAAAKARGLACVAGLDMLFEQIPAYLEFFGFPTGDRGRTPGDGGNQKLAREELRNGEETRCHQPWRTSRGRRQTRMAAASGWIGSALEYYDFFIYATAASLVFPQTFFPSSNPTVAIVASLATYGVGYVARPIGAFALGHYGRRLRP